MNDYSLHVHTTQCTYDIYIYIYGYYIVSHRKLGLVKRGKDLTNRNNSNKRRRGIYMYVDLCYKL